MPGSSELSDALNPFFYHDGSSLSLPVPLDYDQYAIPTAAPSVVQPHPQPQPPPPPPQQHQQLLMHNAHPYTSELADAVNPSVLPPTSSMQPAPLKQSRQPPANPMQLLKGLIHSLTSYKAAVEREKERRMAWERETESKYIARIEEMQLEIDALRAAVAIDVSPTLTARSTAASPSSGQVEHALGAVLSPGKLEAPASKQPEFVQGSSTLSIVSRKRGRSSSADVVTEEHEPTKLRTHRDSRPQTIHAAMRNHILKNMQLENDKTLPDSHIEGAPLDSDSVRFVWETTTKKSAHNRKMKNRVIADMIAEKELYPLVPAQEFTEWKLDSVFEQAFTTLRNKYTTQKSSGGASTLRDLVKSRRARRASRKKTKLANRQSTRTDIVEYSDRVFDGAFKLECMSSEESSDGPDDASSDGQSTNKALRIRCPGWRSSRLTQLFKAIDLREREARTSKPKRGVGRKDRLEGPPKDGNPPPPPGVAHWMVSKKWLREAHEAGHNVHEIVQPDNGGGGGDDSAVWQALRVLGDESEDEGPEPEGFLEDEEMPAQQLTALVPPGMAAAPFQHQYLPAVQQSQRWVNGMGMLVDVPVFSPTYTHRE